MRHGSTGHRFAIPKLCSEAEERKTPVRERLCPSGGAYISVTLVEWFHEHGRTFDWRLTRNPYHVLCAEVFLQRTRATQVAGVFRAFVQKYPSPGVFIAAGKDAAQAIFSKLGLLWRAELFWDLQVTLHTEFDDCVPNDHTRLLALPGVGEYAATATRVFAFGEIDTVVDANVLRIFARFFGTPLPEHLRRNRGFRDWVKTLAPTNSDECKEFNWALIDHGAMVCTPRSPRCFVCPLSPRCSYRRAADTTQPAG
jgi:A/G-specific adenine glycosylase